MKKRYVFLFLVYFALVWLFLGCDAFVRKFRRKPKQDFTQKEMILVPEEYPSLFANPEDAYRQYFSFWQAWHMEFINSLKESSSHKKKIFCLNEAIKNLNLLKDLLKLEKQQDLDKYIHKLEELKAELSKDIYTMRVNWYTQRAETIKKEIFVNFSYPKIKGCLK